MRVLLLSPTDIKGGASKVAFNLARGLNEHGVESDLYVNHKYSNQFFVKELPFYEINRSDILKKFIHRFGINQLNLNSTFPKYLQSSFFKQYDIIHLHDLPSGFNYAYLPWLSRIRPIIWTIHSMQPLTGNCMFAYDCERWKTKCGKCPQFGQWPLKWLHRDGSKINHTIKKYIYRHSQLKTVGVSSWTTEQIKQSILKNTAPETILNPVDTIHYFPEDKKYARKVLKIPDGYFVIMFSTGGSSEDKRKGLDIIKQALEQLQNYKIFLLPTGINDVPETLNELQQYQGLPPVHLTKNDDLRIYYNAADVIWHPTRADTSSMIALEAMACGTPVIAASVGGVPEVITYGMNGCLIPPNSSEELAKTTLHLMNNLDELELLRNKNTFVLEMRSLDNYVQQHTHMYNQLISKW